MKLKENFICPNCSREMIAKSGEEGNSNGILIKSKLVFLNDNGDVMGKCKKCKTVISLPLSFDNNLNSIENNNLFNNKADRE